MLAEAGIIIGRISEISGKSELIIGESVYVHDNQKQMRDSIKSKVTKRCRCIVEQDVTWAGERRRYSQGEMTSLE
jgi:hypothetical protein